MNRSEENSKSQLKSSSNEIKSTPEELTDLSGPSELSDPEDSWSEPEDSPSESDKSAELAVSVELAKPEDTPNEPIGPEDSPSNLGGLIGPEKSSGELDEFSRPEDSQCEPEDTLDGSKNSLDEIIQPSNPPGPIKSADPAELDKFCDRENTPTELAGQEKLAAPICPIEPASLAEPISPDDPAELDESSEFAEMDDLFEVDIIQRERMRKRRLTKNVMSVTDTIQKYLDNKSLEYLRYYIKSGGKHLSVDRIYQSKVIKFLSQRLYIVKDTLFYNTPEGDPLSVVGYGESDRINNILLHFHGEDHKIAKEMQAALEKEYIGISMYFTRAWVQNCPVCKGVIVGKVYTKRFTEVIKVVREPWFAVCIFTVNWHEVVPGKGGVIFFIMDIYSRYILYKTFRYFDPTDIEEYLREMFDTYGIPEIVKIVEENLEIKEVLRLCREKEIQVVTAAKNPEHFTTLAMKCKKFQQRWTRIEINKLDKQKKISSYENALKNIILKQNNSLIERGGYMKIRRIPSHLFYRRITRIKKKNNQYFKKYKIQRIDLPSIIEYIPEDPVIHSESIGEDNRSINNSTKKPFNESDNKPDNELPNEMPGPDLPILDRDLEKIVRPPKRIQREIFLYNARNPDNKMTEATMEEDQCIVNGFKMKGKIAYLVCRDAVQDNMVDEKYIFKANIPKLMEKNKWPIDMPTTADLFVRRIDPNKMEFLPDRYWLVEQNKDLSTYKLYNIDKKTYTTASWERIFQAKEEIIEKSKHIISFLFDKFTRGRMAIKEILEDEEEEQKDS